MGTRINPVTGLPEDDSKYPAIGSAGAQQGTMGVTTTPQTAPKAVATAPMPASPTLPPSPSAVAISGQTKFDMEDPGYSAGPAPTDHTAEAQGLMAMNPTMFPTIEDALEWGKRYYGWGAVPTGTGGGGTTTTPTTTPTTTTPTTTTGTGGTTPTTTPAAAPTFTAAMLGTAADWANPQASWQRLMAVHGGALTPEQRAYVNAQIAAGAGAANPFAPGGSGTGAGGGTVPAGTTAGGVQPAGTIPVGTTSTTITGAGGTGTVSTTNGQTTGTAPAIELGNTTTVDPMQALMRSKITGLLNTDPNAASITDPDLAPQADAYSAARERARRQQQAASMERLGAQGVASSGAADVAANQSYETSGQDVAAFNAGLVGDKLKDRQETLQAAIQVASQMGMADEAANLSRQLAGLNAQISMMQLGTTQQGQQLQAKIANMDTQTKTYLANLDADLRREGISAADRLARMSNEMQKYGIDVQGNLGLLNAVINIMQMEQQNEQFLTTTGLNAGFLEAGLNNGLISTLLNG